jgi:hypothetical protein
MKKSLAAGDRENRWLELQLAQKEWDIHPSTDLEERRAKLSQSNTFMNSRLKCTMLAFKVKYGSTLQFELYPQCHLCSLMYSNGETTYKQDQRHKASNCAEAIISKIMKSDLPLQDQIRLIFS